VMEPVHSTMPNFNDLPPESQPLQKGGRR